jgi:hypothetical protein
VKRNVIKYGFPESTGVNANVVLGPGTGLPNFGNFLDIDIGGNTITLTKSTSNVGFGWAPNFSFNGFRFTDLNDTIANFTSFSILSQTNVNNLSAANLSFIDNVLSIDLGNTGWNSLNGSTATFTFATVSEPSIFALFGLGLVGIGFARRRRAGA